MDLSLHPNSFWNGVLIIENLKHHPLSTAEITALAIGEKITVLPRSAVDGIITAREGHYEGRCAKGSNEFLLRLWDGKIRTEDFSSVYVYSGHIF